MKNSDLKANQTDFDDDPGKAPDDDWQPDDSDDSDEWGNDDDWDAGDDPA